MRVLLAPDKLAGSLTASQVAAALARGVRAAGAEPVERPIADGGEGTVDALLAAGWTARPVVVHGADGSPVEAVIATRDGVAVVELAQCCGRPTLPAGPPQPLTATTRGAGAAVRLALDAGASSIVVAVGGSASTDGGLGFLAALGVRIVSADGATVRTPIGLTSAAEVDDSGVDGRLRHVPLTFAVDVHAPLLGPTGAARLFGPQKGAGPAEVDALEAAMTRWAAVLAGRTGQAVADVPGAGAAGGVVAGGLGGLAGVCAVDVRGGADFVIEAVGLPSEIGRADLVVVAEGRLDASTLLGKAPAVVARHARRAGVRVVAVVGRLDLDRRRVRDAGIDDVIELAVLAEPDEDAMRDAAAFAERAGRLLIG